MGIFKSDSTAPSGVSRAVEKGFMLRTCFLLMHSLSFRSQPGLRSSSGVLVPPQNWTRSCTDVSVHFPVMKCRNVMTCKQRFRNYYILSDCHPLRRFSSKHDKGRLCIVQVVLLPSVTFRKPLGARLHLLPSILASTSVPTNRRTISVANLAALSQFNPKRAIHTKSACLPPHVLSSSLNHILF